jgi:hypothetical protein
MSEAITKLFVLEQLRRLHVAFPSHSGMKHNPEATAREYCDAMHGLTGESLRAAVKIWMENEKFFPKIAELRAFAWEWTRRNRAEVSPVELSDPLWCPRCHSRLQWLERWRPRIDARTNQPVISEDGKYVSLERYERLLCRCAVPCVFSPELEFEEPWMLRGRVTQLYGAPGSSRRSSRVSFPTPMTDESRGQPLPLPEQLMHAGAIAENIAAEALVR